MTFLALFTWLELKHYAIGKFKKPFLLQQKYVFQLYTAFLQEKPGRVNYLMSDITDVYSNLIILKGYFLAIYLFSFMLFTFLCFHLGYNS